MKIEDQITVAAPIDVTFDTFSDIEGAAPILSGLNKVEILSDGDVGVGTRWRETRKMYGKESTEEMWMTEFDAPNRYVVAAESHGMKYESVYDFTATDDGDTHVQSTFSGEPLTLMAKIMSVPAGLMMGSVKKAFHQDMVDMKAYAETRATGD